MLGACCGSTTGPLQCFNTSEPGCTFYGGTAFVPGYSCINVDHETCGILPVELLSFVASIDGIAINLAWQTASETNNTGFALEHLRGGSFEEIASIESRGSIYAGASYSYRVNGLDPGSHRFRLRMVGRDGIDSFSQVVEIALPLLSAYRVDPAYPNPFSTTTSLRLAVSSEQEIRVSVFDALGRLVRDLPAIDAYPHQLHLVTIDGAGLPDGMYLIAIAGEHFSASRTVLLAR
jgi:hypothetical protein